jgi:hypothetical protein
VSASSAPSSRRILKKRFDKQMRHDGDGA